MPDGAVCFTVWAPNARHVRVSIEDGDAAGEHELAPTRIAGEFAATIDDVGAGARYGFLLDNASAPLPDPVSRHQPDGVHGRSRVTDPRAQAWTDAEWRGRSMRELVIYELHVGTFTDAGTFDAAIAQLPALVALGITAIELMPVAQFPGARNWGYDGVQPYAPHDGYGGPDALKRLVDAAHGAGLCVILDVVYNHLGPEGNYLGAYGPYFTDTYRTPWGRAVNYDGPDSDEVRRFVIDNARYWVEEFHMDGLRLDAVHGIFDFGARHLLHELAASVHALSRELGRTVVVIGESDLNDPELLRSREEHGHGLDAQWSDDFHHAVHGALTKETRGYYQDFGSATMIGEALTEPFVYDGRPSLHRKRRHGAPSTGSPRDRFVVCIQNHDQVGNRAIGDRLTTMLSPEQQRLATSLLLLSPYVPMLFMGEEYGEVNPFQYFTSHGDPALAQAVRDGRRREFSAFGWSGDVPDPQADSTFERSKLDRTRAATPSGAAALALHRDLLALRREEPTLVPGAATVNVQHGEPGWILLKRGARVQGMDASRYAESVALFNCTAAPMEIPIDAWTMESRWSLRWSSESPGYGGAHGHAADFGGAQRDREADGPRRLMDAPTAPASRNPACPPWSAALYLAEAAR
ncbi:MAG: malto-oligosyltrehalose trehalohydrolase [Gemmatimonadetes bacterium]|nr:malto-oligosyltrehalose trehalohydrolase [Gemmatimonadota bacterium]